LVLFASGELPEVERTRAMSHFAKCGNCRAKLAEFQNLARGLDAAGRRLPHIEPSVALRRRWMTAVQAAAADSRGARGTAPSAGDAVFGWLSGRRLAWGSLTAMWALVLFFRCAGPDTPMPAAVASAPSASLREVLLALKVDKPHPSLRADTGQPAHPTHAPSNALPPHSRRREIDSTTRIEIA